jgi:hypothetical protein
LRKSSSYHYFEILKDIRLIILFVVGALSASPALSAPVILIGIKHDEAGNTYSLGIYSNPDRFRLVKKSASGNGGWSVDLWDLKSTEYGFAMRLDTNGEIRKKEIFKKPGSPPKSTLDISDEIFVSVLMDEDRRYFGVDFVLPKLFLISVGVNHYEDTDLRYGESDAKKIADSLSSQYLSLLGSRKKYAHREVTVLTGSNATYRKLDSVFTNVQKNAGAADYFVFCFAGVSVISKSGEMRFLLANANVKDAYLPDAPNDKAFNLLQLRNWLNTIPSKNQAIISEAGVSADFAKNLEKIIVGTDPIEALLSRRNRIVIATTESGTESDAIKGAPLFHAIATLEFPYLFDLFNRRSKSVEYQILTSTGRATLSGGFYATVFYEQDLMDILKNFSPPDQKTRGGTSDVIYTENKPNEIQNYALVIGIDQYDDPIWGDLVNPVADAKAVESDLRNLYGFQTELLINPTKRDINMALLRYYNLNYDSISSQLLIYWAGHGGYDEFISGYLVAKDSKNKEQDPLRDTYIEHSKLRNMLSNINCPHIMLVLDACFGGTFDQRISKMPHRGPEVDPNNVKRYDPKFVQRKLRYKSRLYLTSGGKEYVPDGRPGQHSPFTRQFLNTLRQASDNDRMVTFSELRAGVEKLQPEPCAGEFDGNTPGGDFLLLLKN